MVLKINKDENVVCLVGLGYVGLPLAEMFSQHFRVIGFDIDKEKIKRLSTENSDLEFTSDSLKIKLADFVINSGTEKELYRQVKSVFNTIYGKQEEKEKPI